MFKVLLRNDKLVEKILLGVIILGLVMIFKSSITSYAGKIVDKYINYNSVVNQILN